MPDLFERALCGVLAREGFPLVVVGSNAWLVPCVLELDEGEARISPIARPPKGSWIEMYTDDQGWDFFCEDESNEWHYDDLGWCMRRGIAPDQRFYILLSVESSGGVGMYGEDYDETWGAGVVWVEHISRREHVNRIEEMLIGWWAQDKKHADHKWAWECRVARAPQYVHVTRTHQGVVVSLTTAAEPPCTCCRFLPYLESRTGDSINDVPDIIREQYWDAFPLLIAQHLNTLALGRILCPGSELPEIAQVGKRVGDATLYSPLSELECELKIANSIRRLDVY